MIDLHNALFLSRLRALIAEHAADAGDLEEESSQSNLEDIVSKLTDDERKVLLEVATRTSGES